MLSKLNIKITVMRKLLLLFLVALMPVKAMVYATDPNFILLVYSECAVVEDIDFNPCDENYLEYFYFTFNESAGNDSITKVTTYSEVGECDDYDGSVYMSGVYSLDFNLLPILRFRDGFYLDGDYSANTCDEVDSYVSHIINFRTTDASAHYSENSYCTFDNINSYFNTAFELHPIFNLELSSNTRFLKKGQSLSVELSTKANITNGLQYVSEDYEAPNTYYNCGSSDQNYPFIYENYIQVRIKSVGTWKNAYMYYYDQEGTINISYSNIANALGAANMMGEECQVRLAQKAGLEGNMSSSYFYSTPVSFYYLPALEFSNFSTTNAKCNGGKGYFETDLSITPDATYSTTSSTMKIQYLLYQYTETDEEPSLEGIKDEDKTATLDGKTVYFATAKTQRSLSTAGTLSDSIEPGIYKLKAYVLKNGTHYYPASKVFKITEPDALAISDFSSTNESSWNGYEVGTGQTTGEVNLTANGGTTPYYYHFVNDVEKSAFTVFPSSNPIEANYTDNETPLKVWVTDANNCTHISSSIDFTRADSVKASLNADTVLITCNKANGGTNDADINLSVSDGVGKYNIKVYSTDDLDNAIRTTSNSTETSFYYSNLDIGDYMVNIADITYDSDNPTTEAYEDLFFTVSEPDTIYITDLALPSIDCWYDNGTAVITPSSSNYDQFYAKNSSTNEIIASDIDTLSDLIPENIYSFYFTDNDGCESLHIEDTIAATPSEIIIDSFDITKASCSEVGNGAIELSTSGGTPYYDGYKNEMAYPLHSDSEHYTTKLYDSLDVGTYIFKITDSLECVLKDTFELVTLVDTLHLTSLATTTTYCDERSNGTISATLSRGERPENTFNFVLINADYDELATSGDITDTTYTFNNYAAGIYYIEVTDDIGCGDVLKDTIKVDPNQILLDNGLQTSTATVCDGISSGIITVQAQNGFTEGSAYNYYLIKSDETITREWLSLAGTAVFDTLPYGYYTVIAGDTAQCYDTIASIYVDVEGQPISVDELFVLDQYCDELPGSVSITTSSTKGPIDSLTLTYPNNLSVGLSDSASGSKTGLPGNNILNYSINIIDSIGCQLDTAFALQHLANDPQLSMDILDSVACNAASNGALRINAWQPITTGGYTFYLDEESGADTASFEFDTLVSKEYDISVIDSMGCYTDTTYSMPVIAETLNIALFEPIAASCVRAANAAVQLVASGSMSDDPEYMFVLNKKDTLYGDSVTFTGYPVDGNTIQVYLTDKFGCSDNTVRFNFTARTDSLNIAIDYITDPACLEDSNGVIHAIALNGNPFDNGFYFRVLKQSDNDELATAYGQDSTDISGFPAETYILEVNDSDNCQAIMEDISLSDPEAPEFTFSPGYVSKKGSATGWADATITLGNGKYFAEWYRLADSILVASDTNTGFSTATNLLAGDYMLRIQDTAKCIFWDDSWLEDTVTIEEPDDSLILSLQDLTQVSCNGLSDGVFVLTASGGWGDSYLYGADRDNISYSDSTFEGFAAGTNYMFYVQDTSGVVDSAWFDMTEPDVLTALVDSIIDAACYGTANGAVELIISGGNNGYSVSADQVRWVIGSTIDSLSAGDYLLYVHDSLSCETTVSAFVDEPEAMIVSDTLITDTKCLKNEGSISATISGGATGYSYAWYNSDTVVSGSSSSIDELYSGVYTLEVTDSNGCSQSFDFYVTDSSSLEISSLLTEAVSCWEGSNGSASISISEGFPPYSVTWPDGSNDTIVSNLSSGEYMVYITDAEGCKVYKTFTISTPDSISATLSEMIEPLCLGVADGVLDVLASGGTPDYSYEWDYGRSRSRAPNLDAGTYTVTVTDANSCTNQFSFTLDYSEEITTGLDKDLTICYENTYPLDAGNYEYFTWYQDGDYVSSDEVLMVDESGEYVIEIEDARGCYNSDTITVSVSDVSLGAQFLMASEVELGDTVVVFEASDPVPDSIELILDSALTILETGQYYSYLVTTDTGAFDVTLISYLGDCQDIITKTLTVVLDDGTDEDYKSTAGQVIKNATLYPNPNDGNFSVEVNLYTATSVQMRLVSFATGYTLVQKSMKGCDYYNQSFALNSLIPGTYLLSIQAGDEMKTLKVIIL